MTRPLSIAVVVTSNARRGAEVFGSQLAAGLAERGWRTSFHALWSAPQGAATVDALPLAGRAARLSPRLVMDLARAVRGHDVVLANGGATLRYAVMASGVPGAPKLVYGSIGEPAYWIRGPLHGRLLRIQLRRCAAVFAVSRATRHQLVDLVGVPAQKVSVASTGVSDHWIGVETDPGGQPFRAVWIGSLSAEKNPALAIEAFAEAGVGEMRVVGDGPLRSELEAKAPESVNFVGSVSDVTPHLRWARCLISSSDTEGLPGVVLEALGSGLPVIATDVGGVGDLVSDATGVLVPKRQVEPMARAIRELAGHPDWRRERGRAGRGLVQDEYLLDHSFDRYDALLRSVIGRST
ncbi:MAG: glycosyltransferase family 4 protein [Acidimicrobiia bacterium]|nr:glycosyltransferase family 4 protein [Acidimicrobiia bacterium]MDH4306465.1 glycosyltransferase family 4 protein [Acidimicrobiia bacterium]MDH5294995.1 glycosyltransferase family 4 protein [Acidimicrobiia bacterium]